MADIVPPEVRSRMMAGIRGKDTKPEMIVRKALHKLGFRYLLHSKILPGKPDMVFPKYRAVIFVNGCFWHGHVCSDFRLPKTRKEFWEGKIVGNRDRDKRTRIALEALGYRHLTIWECELGKPDSTRTNNVIGMCQNWLTLYR